MLASTDNDAIRDANPRFGLPGAISSQEGDFVREYTVYSRRGLLSFTLLDVPFVSVIGVLWYYSTVSRESLSQHGVLWGIVLLAWTLAKLNCSRKESLLAIRGLGLQLSSQDTLRIRWRSLDFGCNLSTPKVCFIPLAQISDILLLEGIQGWSIIWYLAIAHNDGGVIQIRVAFEESLPRLAVLEEAYRGTRDILFVEEADKNKGPVKPRANG